MANIEFEQHLADVQLHHKFNFVLKKEQFICFKKLIDGRSVFGQLPTGFGKSVVYTLFPLIMDKMKGTRHTALVISPLISLMNDQLHILKAHDVPSACIMQDMTVDCISAIKSGNVNVILASPESAMLWFKELTSSPLMEQICLLCFDEAHCISQWGLDFRPEYRKIAELVSIFNDVPTLVLTATATEKVFFDLSNLLALPEDTKLVARLPDRPNIYLHLERVVERHEDVLKWLLEHVRGKKLHAKKTILYCRNIKTCETIYMWLMEELEDNAFAGIKSSTTRMIEMFHSRTDHSSAERIMEVFPKCDSHIRIVVATVAFGMGIQIDDIDLIIHWGVECSLTYWQEVGRCARDGRLGLAITYAYSRSITLCNDDISTEMCNTDDSQCIRSIILKQFVLPGMMLQEHEEQLCDRSCVKCSCFLCTCCSNCVEKCKCPGRIKRVLDRLE